MGGRGICCFFISHVNLQWLSVFFDLFWFRSLTWCRNPLGGEKEIVRVRSAVLKKEKNIRKILRLHALLAEEKFFLKPRRWVCTSLGWLRV